MYPGEASLRANEEIKKECEGVAAASSVSKRRRPYQPPVIEKHPPMGNVTFGTNVMPMLATMLAG
jgi:hypothetical protein